MIFSVACRLVAFAFVCCVWLVTPVQVGQVVLWLSFFACFLYVSCQLGNFLDHLPRFRVSSRNKAVFITGCDTGFGYLLANRLDSLGYRIFAGCLSSTSEGAKQLESSSSSKLMVVQIDVTQDESVKKAYDTVLKNLDGDALWAVVNNAGIMIRGELEWMPLEDIKKMFEVNTFGVVRVTKAFLPLLRHHHGRVVTTASFGGRCTFTGFAAYCMSKFATTSFCDGLRMEMVKFGVTVISIEPFSYTTLMTDDSTISKSIDETWSKASDTIKADYGDGYIDVYKECARKFNVMSVNPNVHDVIGAQVEAVTVTNPHYTYTVGDLKSVLGFWLVQRLPRWAKEYAIRRFVTFDTDIAEHLQRQSCPAANGKKVS